MMGAPAEEKTAFFFSPRSSVVFNFCASFPGPGGLWKSLCWSKAKFVGAKAGSWAEWLSGCSGWLSDFLAGSAFGSFGFL